MSVLEVGFYFFTCVLESEFRAPFIWPLKLYLFRILTALKKAKNARADMVFGMIFHTREVLFHICKVLFHICKILFHECGIYSKSLSNVCHFHIMLTLKIKVHKCIANQGGHFEKWFSCRQVDSANFAVLKTSHSSSLLYLFSQQEIVYSTLSYE